MLRKSELFFNPTVFPKRVIDLKATLHTKGGVCFCVPDNWCFHVISHTWSQDIRALSQRVAAALMENGWRKEDDAGGLRYSEAFEQAKFCGEPCYEALREFLSVLLADGVEKVWFDALCINQLNDEEKELEIRSMGAYYRLSAGCYVVPHGIGTEWGYQALDSEGKLPRWFSRAWTLQESLLPKDLNFIVEKFGKVMLQKLAESTWEEDNDWVDWGEETDEFSRRKIPLQSWEHGSSRPELYCLDVRAYREMMLTLINARQRFFRDLQDGGVRLEFNRVYARLHRKEDEVYLEEVVKHIRKRECSREEDRVLSILGLLGFEGDHQVRSNLTLDEQMLRLAKMLMEEKPELLVNLCAADLEGYGGRPHISWLPNLRHSKYSRFEVDLSVVPETEAVTRRIAEVLMMTEEGEIAMQAPTARASLWRQGSISNPPVDTSPLYHLDSGQSFSVHLSQAPPFVGLPYGHEWVRPQDAPFQPQHPQNLLAIQPDGPFSYGWSGGLSIPAHAIHHLKDYQHPTSFTICDNVVLVLLGQCCPHSSAHDATDAKFLIMACVGDGTETKQHQLLHKIGILISEEEQHAMVTGLFSLRPQQFVVGGFGNDLSALLAPDCQAIIKKHILAASSTFKQRATLCLKKFLSFCFRRKTEIQIKETVQGEAG